MRLLVSIMATIALVIGGGFWMNHQLLMSTDKLVEQIDRVNVEIKQSNWEAAAEETDKLNEVWEREANWWPIFFEHYEMDNIEFSMARFKEYVACQDASLSLGQLSEIKLMIEHMPRKEELCLDNIL